MVTLHQPRPRALTRRDVIGVSRSASLSRTVATRSHLNDEVMTSGAHLVPARRENGVPVMSP